MFFKDAYNTLVKLYFEGGIEVCTADGPVTENDGQDVHRPLLARTVVQPDGDVLMVVSPEILARPDVWQGHMEKLVEKIGAIHRFRGFLKWVRVLSPLFLSGSAYGYWKGHMTLSFSTLALSLFPPLVKPLVGYCFKRRLRREMGRF